VADKIDERDLERIQLFLGILDEAYVA